MDTNPYRQLLEEHALRLVQEVIDKTFSDAALGGLPPGAKSAFEDDDPDSPGAVLMRALRALRGDSQF